MTHVTPATEALSVLPDLQFRRLPNSATAAEVLAATPEQRLDWQDRFWARYTAQQDRQLQNDEAVDHAIHRANHEWCD